MKRMLKLWWSGFKIVFWVAVLCVGALFGLMGWASFGVPHWWGKVLGVIWACYILILLGTMSEGH